MPEIGGGVYTPRDEEIGAGAGLGVGVGATTAGFFATAAGLLATAAGLLATAAGFFATGAGFFGVGFFAAAGLAAGFFAIGAFLAAGFFFFMGRTLTYGPESVKTRSSAFALTSGIARPLIG